MLQMLGLEFSEAESWVREMILKVKADCGKASCVFFHWRPPGVEDAYNQFQAERKFPQNIQMSSKTTFTRHNYMSFTFKSEFFFCFSSPASSKERRTLLIKECLPVFGVLVRPSRCSITHSTFLNLSSLPVSLSLSLCLYLSTCLNNRIPPYLYGSQAPLLLWDSGKCSECVKSLNVVFWSSTITKYKQN